MTKATLAFLLGIFLGMNGRWLTHAFYLIIIAWLLLWHFASCK
jgi:hypothetical protein